MSIGSQWTCPGFDTLDHPGARILARAEATAWIRSVLESGRGLYAAASGDKSARSLAGREPVFIIPAKVPTNHKLISASRWAVRHYTRGGRLVSTLLGDRYFRSPRIRPYHEVEASQAARKRGIRTPRVMAAAVYPDGVFYRGDLITEFVENATDLVGVLFDSKRKGVGGAVERADALQAAGGLVRAMASVGLRHRDLHAGNILLEWDGAAPTAHLLDLDRCEVGPEGIPVSPDRMYKRLRRSLRKWESRTGIRISDREWEILARSAIG